MEFEGGLRVQVTADDNIAEVQHRSCKQLS